MQTYKLGILILLTLSIFEGCKYGDTNFKKGPGGLYYKIVDHHSGALIQQEDYVWLNFSALNQEGEKITGSYYVDNRPIKIHIPAPHFKGDLFTGLAMLARGDSAVFKISIDSLLKYKDIDRRPVTKYNYLQYTVKVYTVIGRGEMKDEEWFAKIRAEDSLQVKIAKDAEPAELNNYIASSKIHFEQTGSGMYYHVDKPGQGYKAANGDTAYIYYTLRSLDGEPAETNVKAVAIKAGWYDSVKTIAFIKSLSRDEESKEETEKIARRFDLAKIVTDKNSHSALNEALRLFPKGTKCTLLVPSKLSYQGLIHGSLAAYTPIRCDLEIVDIKPKK